VADALPALCMFAGAVVALVIGVINPRQLFTTGGLVLVLSAVIGFAARILFPRTRPEEAAASQPHGYDLVIFDCDGVLVDSETLAVGVEARVLTELGWSMQAPEVTRRWVGRSSADQLAEIAEQLGPEAAATFQERCTAELDETFRRSLSPVDGVLSVLDHLDEIGLPYAVASSGDHRKIRLTLGITGLVDRFDGRIFSTVDVPNGKPAPDLFLSASQSLGFAPGRCAVVEDSVYGVQAAVAAGMTAYGYAGGLTDARSLAESGAVVFHEMSDLLGLLAHSSSSKA